jgi:hypothetical protein
MSTTVNSNNLPSVQELQADIQSRLNRMKQWVRLRITMEGLARMLVIAAAFLLVTMLVDWKLELSFTGRVILNALSLAGLSYVAWRYAIQPWTTRWSPLDIATAVDLRRAPSAADAIAPRVATVLELNDFSPSNPQRDSELRELAIRQSYEHIRDTDLGQHLSADHRLKVGFALFGAIAAPVLLAVVMPWAMNLWWQRWVMGAETPWPRYTTVAIPSAEDGRLVVPKGEPITIEVEVTATDYTSRHLYTRLTLGNGRRDSTTIPLNGLETARIELPALQQPAQLYLWAGDGKLGPIEIVPIDRPKFVEMRMTHEHDWDDGPQIADLDRGDGSVSLLPKTNVKLVLKSNVAVQSIGTEWDHDNAPQFKQIDPTTFEANWVHERAMTLKLELIGKAANLVSRKRALAIGLRRDRSPTVNLRAEGVRQRITAVASLPLKVMARDDFGVAHIAMNMEIERAPTKGAPKTTPEGEAADSAEPTESDNAESDNAESENAESENAEKAKEPEPNQNDKRTWDLFGPVSPAFERTVEPDELIELSDAKLKVGDMVRIHSVVHDDCFTGKQSNRSGTMSFRVVTSEELFREVLLRQQQMRARFRKATDQAIALRDDIATADLQKDSSDIFRRHQLIQREVNAVQRSLQQSVEEMKLNKLGGPEAHQLIEGAVVKPMQKLTENELPQQQRTLQALSHQPEQKAAEAEQNQEEIVDKMKKILKGMSQWDSFIDVVNQLDAIIKLQNQVRQGTEGLKERETQSIFDK